jgi:hypothetical protein
MAKGIGVFSWDERSGMDVIATYPKNLNLQNNMLLQIYLQHDYTDEEGIVGLEKKDINFISYYTGPEIGVYILLLLNYGEKGETFEDELTMFSKMILADLEPSTLELLLPALFKRI